MLVYKHRKTKVSWSKKLFNVFNVCLMAVIIGMTIVPLINALAVSLSSDITSLEPGLKLWPSKWSLDGFIRLFKQIKIATPLKNSIYTTAVGTILHVFFSCLTAYVLSHEHFPGKKIFIALLLITFAIPIQNIMIPSFILYRNFGLLNTFVPIIISSMVTAYAVMLLKSFFEQIPESMREAAIIDGAGEMMVLIKIYFPLAIPGIATLTLYQIVGKWNILLEPALFITNPRKNTLQIALKALIINSDSASSASFVPNNTIMAGVIICIAPLLLMYPVLQRYFINQLMSGAIKG